MNSKTVESPFACFYASQTKSCKAVFHKFVGTFSLTKEPSKRIQRLINCLLYNGARAIVVNNNKNKQYKRRMPSLDWRENSDSSGIQQQRKMEAQQRQREIQAAVLMELNQVYMHRLLNKDKTPFTSGTLRVAQLNNNEGKPVHFVNLNSFYYGIQPNSFFIRMVYPDTVSYVFPHFENGLSAVSLPTNPAFSEALDQLLARVANLYDLKTALQNPEIQGLVLQHYPNIETQQIYHPDRNKKFITDTGNFLNKFFTTAGGYLKIGVEKTGGFIEGKISEGEPIHVSEATKNKWENIKQGTTNIFNISTEYASQLLAPVVTKAKEYSNDVGNKINQSTNPAVKYAKQITVVSGKAVGSAVEGLVKGSIEVSKEIGHQGKKIIDKKCGSEILQTFAGSKKEEAGKQEEKAEKQEQKEPIEPKVEKEERKDPESQHLYPQINKE